jgi:hypothetical protein
MKGQKLLNKILIELVLRNSKRLDDLENTNITTTEPNVEFIYENM